MESGMRIIDLSQTITDKMPVFPGDDDTKLAQTRFLSTDGYNDHRVEMGMHAGTHIDAPMHLTDSHEYIADLPVDRFSAPGVCIDVRGQPVIDWRPEYGPSVKENCILLLYTGQDRLCGEPVYFENYPILSPAFGQALVDKKIKMLGLDSPSPDRPPYAVHKLLLTHGILIMENLTHLDQLAGIKGFEVIALPIKIKADSAPARVVARVVD
jgi:kynurenine formamidase